MKLLGWAGLLPTIYPWAQAFIWAFKPTDIVDIRRLPREEARAIDEDIARLEDKPKLKPKPKPAEAASPAAEPLPPATPRAGDDS